jgi:uncharacterized repeat protein (TIGR01451 family)
MCVTRIIAAAPNRYFFRIWLVLAASFGLDAAQAQSGNGAFLTASKQVFGGNLQAGGTVSYILLIANQGMGDQADNAGDEFTDVLPSELTLTTASVSSGNVVADDLNNTVHWNGAIPAGASVAMTINANIKAGTAGQTITNQGTYNYDADGNGTNESTGLTVAFGGGPTVFLVKPPVPVISGTKQVVGGNQRAGGSVIYAIVLTNSGLGDQLDNPGDEFIDILPAGLTITNTSASSGIVVVTGASSVSWNGAIAAGTSVTLTVEAGIASDATGLISNQGQINFDADGNGTNDTVVLTDDPTVPGNADPTVFAIKVAPVTSTIPALSRLAAALLIAGLGFFATIHWRRERR